MRRYATAVAVCVSKVNLIILQLSHADSFDIFDKASLSFNQSEIGLRVLHKINIGL